MGISQIIFYLLASFTILTALFVVFSKNPIYSVLWLILCFFSIAGHFVMLNAQFLAVVHIIVYSGAIMVLYLFTVMLLNLNKETEPHKPMLLKFAAVISGGVLFLIILAAMKTSIPSNYIAPQASEIGYVKQIGMKLYREYTLPFEVASILFLSAMIGSVVLAKKERA
ncbi:MAG: NADH-quinone oxidoreductase subunit J [Bacteroidota bacterium]|jgi:NADH-quinone oxidoreductase subunit J